MPQRLNFSDLQTQLNADINGNPCASCSYSAFFNMGGELAVYANYSSDLAQELTYNAQVKGVPLFTAALGVLFKAPRFDTSLIYKIVGNQYLNAYAGPASAANYNDPNQQVQPYGLLDYDFTWKAGKTIIQLNESARVTVAI